MDDKGSSKQCTYSENDRCHQWEIRSHLLTVTQLRYHSGGQGEEYFEHGSRILHEI